MENKNDEENSMEDKLTRIPCSQKNLLDSFLEDCRQQPPSPTSSLATTVTFDLSVEMMVNDFDDEQTLTEEEALAELEAQDPADEIETLQKESEIPLETLLARYRQERGEEDSQQRQHKRKKQAKTKKLSRLSKQSKQIKQSKPSDPGAETGPSSSSNYRSAENFSTIDEVIVIEESEDEVELLKTEPTDTDAADDGSSLQEESGTNIEGDDDDEGEEGEEEFDEYAYENNAVHHPPEQTKLSALALLYPEKYNIQSKIDDEGTEEDEDDDDFVKKTIMVGAAYQADIPTELSKYGDVLPYENEDKLIWEPSQVSEQEVEEYLIRVRELNPAPEFYAHEEEIPSSSASSGSDQGIGGGTVKDDEQALHLLVQCGYNFKEALRRKAMIRGPYGGVMSLWSEEECQNFEDGIQKYGKDFRKIHQFQVRTRSIPELVEFYYLWKKTDRRDKDFIDSDAIDHMDVYLDFDERDNTGSNGTTKNSNCVLQSDNFTTNQDPPSKKHRHNFSIMNKTNRSSGGNQNPPPKKSNKRSHRRRSNSLLSGSRVKQHRLSSDSSSISSRKTSSNSSSSVAAYSGSSSCTNKLGIHPSKK